MVQEIEDEGAIFRVVKDRAAVTGAGDDFQRAGDAGFLQSGVEFLALLQWDERVLVTMENEERRGAFIHVIDGAGADSGDEMGGHGPAQQFVQGGIAGVLSGIGIVAVMEEISWPEKIDHALHGAGLVEIGADVEGFGIAGDAEQRDEMPSRRLAPDADALGIDIVLPRVGAEPADRRFAILDLGGEGRVLAEAVFNAGRVETCRNQRAARAAFL